MAKNAEDNSVAITKMLVARREFWYAVLALIAAVALIVLVTLAVYPQLFSEIVDLWDDDPAIQERFEERAPECAVRMVEIGCLQHYENFLTLEADGP